MNRPRCRTSSTGLLPRMEARPRADGSVAYRYHPAGAKPIALGTDRAAAIRRVLDINTRSADAGTIGHLWRLYTASPAYTRLAAGTQRQYAECWRQLAKVFQHATAAHIRPADVARYLRVERAAAPVVANREAAVLSNLFNLAVERGDIDRNPCKEVRRNKETPRTRLVEHAELQPFVAWALQQGPSATVLVSMAEFAALTGNRRAEFLRLHWPQVDGEIIRLTRAKQHGGPPRRELLAVSQALRAVLDRFAHHRAQWPMGPVFPAPRTGNPYSEAGFKAMWARLMASAISAGIVRQRFTFHDLRAHYTSYYKLKFGHLPDLHADPATTARTYERTRETRREAL